MVAGGGSGLFNEGLDAAAVAAAVSTVSFSQVSVTIVEFFGILCVLLNIFVTRLVKDPPIHAGAHKESVKEQARCSFHSTLFILCKQRLSTFWTYYFFFPFANMDDFSPAPRAPVAPMAAPRFPISRETSSDEERSAGGGGGASNICVYARVRPLLSREEDSPEVVRIINDQHLVVTNGPNDREQRYQLDHIFPPDATQHDVYSILEPSIRDCFDGYNTTIFAYGQTGTGKTHTVLGLNLWEMAEMAAENSAGGGSGGGGGGGGGGVATFNPQDINAKEDMWGLIPRAGRYIFDEIYEQEKETEGQVKFEVKCTYLELYNERLYDLFKEGSSVGGGGEGGAAGGAGAGGGGTGGAAAGGGRGLEIRQDKMQGVFVPNATSVTVNSEHDLLGLLWEGAKHRAISATDMNTYSSRSHTILQIQITRRPISDAVLPKYALIKRAKLNIIDLAGSETMKRNKISKFSGECFLT